MIGFNMRSNENVISCNLQNMDWIHGNNGIETNTDDFILRYM